MTDNVNALAGKEFDGDDIWNILETWPTMNMHTGKTICGRENLFHFFLFSSTSLSRLPRIHNFSRYFSCDRCQRRLI